MPSMRRPWLLLIPLVGIFVAAMLSLPAREGWSGDEPEYLNLADNIAHGFYREGTTDGPLNMCFPGWTTPDLWYGPGFPAFLSPLVAAGLSVSVIRFVGPLLLLASVLLFYRLLLFTVRPRVALAGAFALGLFVPLYRYLPFLHSEFLALALVTGSMLAIAAMLRGGGRLTLALAVACLAGLALTRVAFGWVLTILFVIWLVRWAFTRSATARRLALAYGLALALCAPWLAYTWHVTERPLLWGTSGSLSLYWMSSPYPEDRGDWHCASDVFTEDWLAPHRTFFSAHASESPTEQNRALERRAREQIVDHPGKYAENLAANGSRMLFNTPYGRRGLDARTLVFLVPGVLLVGSLAAAIALLVRRRRTLPPEGAAFALFAAVAFAVHLPISAYTRMFIPILPPVLWLVVVGLAGAVRSEKWRTKTRR